MRIAHKLVSRVIPNIPVFNPLRFYDPLGPPRGIAPTVTLCFIRIIIVNGIGCLYYFQYAIKMVRNDNHFVAFFTGIFTFQFAESPVAFPGNGTRGVNPHRKQQTGNLKKRIKNTICKCLTGR